MREDLGSPSARRKKELGSPSARRKKELGSPSARKKDEDLGKPYYGFNAVRYITIASIGVGIACIAIGVISVVSAYPMWFLILCWALGVVLLVTGVLWHLIMGFASSPKKLELLQSNFLQQLEAIWDGKGKVLDIGTGSGRAAIEIAKRFPEAQVIGVDMWSKGWRFFGVAKARAEKNAAIENVSDRCVFQRGNALDLPFQGEEFQLVVSSFVFHEIKTFDRTKLFEEAIAVLAPGGVFMVCDCFGSLKPYKVENIPQLLRKVEKLGAQQVKYKSLEEAGASLGGLAHVWGIAYVIGRKAKRG